MECLWPSTSAASARIPGSPDVYLASRCRGVLRIAAFIALSSLPVWGSSPTTPDRTGPNHPSIGESERQLHRGLAHISEFRPVTAPLALPKCGDIKPPEALLTPDPLLSPQDETGPVVSFIVGADGLVHSAFVLSSGGPAEDELMLRTVRKWRYRPARCNGVPVPSEARVRFSVP